MPVLNKTLLSASNNDGFANLSHGFDSFGVSAGTLLAQKTVSSAGTITGGVRQGATTNRYSDFGIPSDAKIISLQLTDYVSGYAGTANGTLTAYLQFWTDEADLGEHLVAVGGSGSVANVAASNLTGNSYVRFQVDVRFNIDVDLDAIYGNAEITMDAFQVDIVYQTVNSVGQTGLSRVQVSVLATQTGASRLQNQNSNTQSAISRIQQTLITATIAGTSRLRSVVPVAQPGLSRVQVSVLATQPGISRLQKEVIVTQSGVASVESGTVTSSDAQVGIARVQLSSLRTAEGISRLQKESVSLVDGISRITSQVNANITGSAQVTNELRTDVFTVTFSDSPTVFIFGQSRIQAQRSREQVGISRLGTQSLSNISGVANILQSSQINNPGISRLQQSTDALQEGIARLKNTAESSQSGISRIQSLNIQNLDGTAAILVTGTNTSSLSGTARLTRSASQTQPGIASIQTATLVNQSGVGFIQSQNSSSIIGRSRIFATMQTQISGAARIIVVQPVLKYPLRAVFSDSTKRVSIIEHEKQVDLIENNKTVKFSEFGHRGDFV